jgi:hypothetical protein
MKLVTRNLGPISAQGLGVREAEAKVNALANEALERLDEGPLAVKAPSGRVGYAWPTTMGWAVTVSYEPGSYVSMRNGCWYSVPDSRDEALSCLLAHLAQREECSSIAQANEIYAWAAMLAKPCTDLPAIAMSLAWDLWCRACKVAGQDPNHYHESDQYHLRSLIADRIKGFAIRKA